MIGGIIQHLNLQPIERVVEQTGGADDPLGHDVLVVHRQLHGDPRELLEGAVGFVMIVAMLAVEIDQDVAVQAVERDGAKDACVASHQQIPPDAVEHKKQSQSEAWWFTAAALLRPAWRPDFISPQRSAVAKDGPERKNPPRQQVYRYRRTT